MMAVEAAPKAQVFSMRTQLLSAGRTNLRVAETDALTITMKVYSEGGENALHTHPIEDHAFVVLQGEATFYDETETPTVVNKNEGILLPHGAFYYFKSTGDENLVLLRVGTPNQRTGGARVALDGHDLLGESSENKHIDGVPVPGKFYGD